MKNVYTHISKILADEKIIENKDIAICKYGLEMFVLSVIEIMFILILSILTKNFFNTLLFLTFFISLRIYAGGYHAETKTRCFLVFLATHALFTITINHLPIEHYLKISTLSMILSIVIVLMKSPIINTNKIVCDNEINAYRKISIFIVVLQSLVIVIGLLLFPLSKLILSLTLGQLMVAISMIAAIMKNKLQGGANNEKD